jgi:hypothetical protein
MEMLIKTVGKHPYSPNTHRVMLVPVLQNFVLLKIISVLTMLQADNA